MYVSFIKPSLDFVVSLIILLVLTPFLVIVAVLVKITSKGPVFFQQGRLGRNNKVFLLYKFRSMTDEKRSVDREIYSGDREVTKFGSFLRRFKIDELPQIINVLKGEMSLVGPRPCMPFQVADFNEDARARSRVRPGLTGLAQINGNIFLTWEERWKYDREYAEKVSFFLDCVIIFRTFLIIVFGEKKYLKIPEND